MKKKRTLALFCAATLLSCAVGIAACGEDAHTHTFSDDWSKNETAHWHAATCGHTDEKQDLADHAWNDGEITTPATAQTKGVKTFTCTVCGQTKTEEVEYTVDTTMTEEEWNEAFVWRYKNLTYELRTAAPDETPLKVELLEDGSMHQYAGLGWSEDFYKVNPDGTVTTYYNDPETGWKSRKICDNLQEYEETHYHDDTGIVESILPNIKYSDYTYDKENDCYTSNKHPLASEDMPMPDDASLLITVKFDNKKLVSFNFTLTAGTQTSTTTITFYNYGTTVINFPTVI